MQNISKPGRHKVTASNTQFGTTPSANDYLRIEFTTDEGEHIAGFLWVNSDENIIRTQETLEEAFGWNGDASSIEKQVDGKECSVVCEWANDAEGKTKQMRVRWINPPGGGKITPPKDEAILREKLSKSWSMRKKMVGASGFKATPTPITPGTRQPVLPVNQDDDEEVPF
jgi:hypothetical protein